MISSTCTSVATISVTDTARKYLHRANHFWWHNAYQKTKAMGEMVLNEIRGDTPLLIIRPTVIESSYKQPFPGWIQGNRMFDPIIIFHAKGQLPAFLGDPDAHMDIIPVDMVANSTIAAIAKHGVTNKPELNVYQVASDVANLLQYGEFFEIIYEYFKLTPLFVANNLKKVKCFDNFEEFSKYTRAEILRQHNNNGADKKCKVKVAYAEQLCKTYEFVGFFKARFHTGNTTKLLSEMSKQEQIDFEMDPNTIVWRNYFLDSHIPGLYLAISYGSSDELVVWQPKHPAGSMEESRALKQHISTLQTFENDPARMTYFTI